MNTAPNGTGTGRAGTHSAMNGWSGPRAWEQHQQLLHHLAAFVGLWLLKCATVATAQFASSTPNSAWTQHVPAWCCAVAMAAGPLLAAVAVALTHAQKLQQVLLAGMPWGAYMLWLVPAVAAGVLEQWLASSVLVAVLGSSWRVAACMQPLVVAAMCRQLLGDRALHVTEAWSVIGLAVSGLLPLLWVLGLEGAVALAAQLMCSCGSLVLLQALLRQEGVHPLGVLVHGKAWQLLLVVLQQVLAASSQQQASGHQSLGYIAAHTVDLCYPWLLAHSLVVCVADWLQLVLLQETGAFTVAMVAALASTFYPAIWGIVTAPGTLQRVLCALCITGLVACSAAFWGLRWRRHTQARQNIVVRSRPPSRTG